MMYLKYLYHVRVQGSVREWLLSIQNKTRHLKWKFCCFFIESVLCYLYPFALTLDVTANVLLVKDGGQDVTDKSGVALRLKTDKNPSWHTSKPERTGPFQSEEFNDPAELLPEFLAKKHFQLPVQVLVRTSLHRFHFPNRRAFRLCGTLRFTASPKKRGMWVLTRQRNSNWKMVVDGRGSALQRTGQSGRGWPSLVQWRTHTHQQLLQEFLVRNVLKVVMSYVKTVLVPISLTGTHPSALQGVPQ